MTRARHIAAFLTAAALAVGTYLAFEHHDLGMAPSVEYTLLDGTKGNTDQLRGQVVLVNFWATSCEPCIREMPKIIATHERFRQRGLRTLAVSMRDDPPAAVIDYAQTRELPFDVAIDITGGIARSFGEVQVTPTTLLIDRHGRIVHRYIGEPDFAALQQQVEALLAQA